MTKAYDLKELGEIIVKHAKGKGLMLAEEALEELGLAVYSATKEWATESAKLSENKVDDAVVPFFSMLDTWVDAQIVKIDLDGKEIAEKA